MTTTSTVTPALAKRRLEQKLGFPKEETYRLNVQMTREELGLLRLAADMFAEGNISRLVRYLTLSVLPRSYESINRETGRVMLTVSAIPPKGRPPQLHVAQ